MLTRVKIRRYNHAIDSSNLCQALLDYELAQNVAVVPEAIKGDYINVYNAFDVLDRVIAFQEKYDVTLELEVSR